MLFTQLHLSSVCTWTEFRGKYTTIIVNCSHKLTLVCAWVQYGYCWNCLSSLGSTVIFLESHLIMAYRKMDKLCDCLDYVRICLLHSPRKEQWPVYIPYNNDNNWNCITITYPSYSYINKSSCFVHGLHWNMCAYKSLRGNKWPCVSATLFLAERKVVHTLSAFRIHGSEYVCTRVL